MTAPTTGAIQVWRARDGLIISPRQRWLYNIQCFARDGFKITKKKKRCGSRTEKKENENRQSTKCHDGRKRQRWKKEKANEIEESNIRDLRHNRANWWATWWRRNPGARCCKKSGKGVSTICTRQRSRWTISTNTFLKIVKIDKSEPVLIGMMTEEH